MPDGIVEGTVVLGSFVMCFVGYALLVSTMDRCYLKEISDSLHNDPLRRGFYVNVNLENDTFTVEYREQRLESLEIVSKVDGSKISLKFRGLRNNPVITLQRENSERTLTRRDDQRRVECILRKVHGALGVVSRRSYAS